MNRRLVVPSWALQRHMAGLLLARDAMLPLPLMLLRARRFLRVRVFRRGSFIRWRCRRTSLGFSGPIMCSPLRVPAGGRGSVLVFAILGWLRSSACRGSCGRIRCCPLPSQRHCVLSLLPVALSFCIALACRAHKRVHRCVLFKRDDLPSFSRSHCTQGRSFPKLYRLCVQFSTSRVFRGLLLLRRPLVERRALRLERFPQTHAVLPRRLCATPLSDVDDCVLWRWSGLVLLGRRCSVVGGCRCWLLLWRCRLERGALRRLRRCVTGRLRHFYF